MGFNFAAGSDNQAQGMSYLISNYCARSPAPLCLPVLTHAADGYTIPQVAVAWPSTQTCQTRRCYSTSCDATQALPKGEKSQSVIAGATSTCQAANGGLTLYCTSPSRRRLRRRANAFADCSAQ
jgi:hypothetical protein